MKRILYLTILLVFSRPLSAAEQPIKVGVYEGPGAGPSCGNLLEALRADGRASNIKILRLSPEAIRSGELKNIDVLIHPGGSGGGQGRALETKGREAVRDFVRTGGGFIGICAGGYLATDDYTWSLGLIEARVVDRNHWARGTGSVDVALSPKGQVFFGTGDERITIHYGQGPLLARREWDNPLAPEYESLGIFHTEIAEKGAPKGIMPGTSAIVRASFEKGRVFVFSPHPEMTDGLGFMVERAVRWAAHRDAPIETNSPPAPPGEIEHPRISAVVRKYFPIGSDGGVAVLVVRENEVLHRKGYGRKNGETPITPDTPMPLASVSKQFAAMCAAFLIEEGRLRLTDKVSDHLPDLNLKTKGRPLLVQDLLWHISGLPNFIESKEKASIEAFKKAHGISRLTNKTHADWLATTPVRRVPGIQFEYTNSGYVLLARLIEILVGKPFHEFQRERIFDVLGMKNTSDSVRFNGSGNMLTTLNDYRKWDRALREGALLKPETWKQVTRSGVLDNGEPVGYGFGWRVVHENGDLVEMSHSGSGSAPASSRNMILRDLRTGITVAFLARENLKFTLDLRTQIAEELRDQARLLK
jgi:CubicO group peptidase (beta-lactamase class C family)